MLGGIGLTKGRNLAYRSLTRYLVSSSDYVDAREGSLEAATDLFGANSTEVGDVIHRLQRIGTPRNVPYVERLEMFDGADPGGGNTNDKC